MIYLGATFAANVIALIVFLYVIARAKRSDRAKELDNQIRDDVEELLNDLENGPQQR
jgi:hypothetical protein